MLKIRTLSLMMFSGVMVTSACYAEDWNGEGEFGYTSTSGNTESKTLNTKLSVGKKVDKWDHNAKIEVLTTSNNGVDSANSVVFTEKSQYSFAEKTFSFGRLRYEEDEFSGFEYQSVISFGVGHVFISGGKHNLEASAGAGYKDFKEDLLLAEKVQEAVFDGELKYAYKISETSEFNQNFLVESGNSNTYSKSETFLKLVVVGNLGAKFGYEVKNNSGVPDGVKKTDTITTVTLVYSF